MRFVNVSDDTDQGKDVFGPSQVLATSIEEPEVGSWRRRSSRLAEELAVRRNIHRACPGICTLVQLLVCCHHSLRSVASSEAHRHTTGVPSTAQCKLTDLSSISPNQCALESWDGPRCSVSNGRAPVRSIGEVGMVRKLLTLPA